jgi:hypothetical protein
MQPYIADLAINPESPSPRAGRTLRRAFIQEIGDLSVFHGLEEVDARDYYVTTAQSDLRFGAEAALLFYRKGSSGKVDWEAADLETRFPPDAIYRNGEWVRRGSLTVKSP